ncbi:MAG: hypothetical protein M3Z05_03255 [Gemmatimonadota bacterium]|nr:hypothetical protein [Gemmatimonadota bacterium]
MPKILVLFAGQSTTLVDALADGARAVRFSEVEVRRVRPADESTSGAHAILEGVVQLVPYDAIVVGLSQASGELDAEQRQVLNALASVASRPALENKIGSAFVTHATTGVSAGGVWPALSVLGDLGLLVVAPAGSDAEAASALGGRVAQLAAAMAHVRSHHHH